MIKADPRLYEELAYCVPIGLEYDAFLGWSDRSQDLALAYKRLEREQCPGCGTRLEEWDGNDFAYVAESFVCPGCEVLELEDGNIPDKAKGVRKRLVPNPAAT